MSTPYRTAIVGARRGLHHLKGYAGLENRARVVALAEIDDQRRAAAVAELGPSAHVYANWLEMLERERPDILHVVTTPTIPRAQWVRPAAEAGVRVLAIEKPIALRPAEAEALYQAAVETGLKIAVNHQRRYMPFANTLLELLADPERGLGPVQFVRASTYGPVMDMATHLLDVVLLALGDDSPTHVWAAAEGVETIPAFYGPRQVIAEFSFQGGARAFFEASSSDDPPFGTRDFPATLPPNPVHWWVHRCNIDIWAERGRFWWREFGTWGYQVEGRPSFSGPTAFVVDDLPAQRAYTAALVDWLEGTPHRCALPSARLGFDLLQGSFRSAFLGRRLTYPEAGALADPEWSALITQLGAPEEGKAS